MNDPVPCSIPITFGNQSSARATHTGGTWNIQNTKLSNTLLLPDLAANLISSGKLLDDEISDVIILKRQEARVLKNSKLQLQFHRKDGLYEIENAVTVSREGYHALSALQNGSATTATVLHRRFAHCNSKVFRKITQLRHMKDPRMLHWHAAIRVVGYLKGTQNLRLFYPTIGCDALIAFSDSDWAGDKLTRRSTSGMAIMKGGMIYWKSKLHSSVALPPVKLSLCLAVKHPKNQLDFGSWNTTLKEEHHRFHSIICG
jgi:hypothetical protein